MATHKSAGKRARQSLQRAARNLKIKSAVKTAVRTFRDALKSGDKAQAASALNAACRTLRKAGSKGVLHKTTVSRRVSRLEIAFNAVG